MGHRARAGGTNAAARTGRAAAWARALLAAGVLLCASVAFTWASFTDSARVNLGPTGIGSPTPFDIALVDGDGLVQQADGEAGLSWPITGAPGFVPGHTLTVPLKIFNNSPVYGAELSMIVEAVGDGSIADSPNITRFLALSAVDEGSGETLFGNPLEPEKGVGLAAATAVVGGLAARGTDPLATRSTYAPGAEGSARDITLSIHYTDHPDTRDCNGGQSALRVKFDAQTV